MRKLQLITYDVNHKLFPNITVSSLSSPRSLDEYDVNIIDLSDADIWKSYQSNETVNSQNDFISIRTMVIGKKRSLVLYLLPQNVTYYCNYDPVTRKHTRQIRIKDMLDFLSRSILPFVFPTSYRWYSLVYENTRTTINHIDYEADLFFDTDESLTISNMSEKCTTVRLSENNDFATTLRITKSQSDLISFIDNVFPEERNDDIPDWVKKTSFGSDQELQGLIDSSNKLISKEMEKIKQAEKELQQNLHYKSILFSNGDVLVRVVFEMLQELLSCDLSGFVDEKKEDFLIRKGEHTFIGEIKGVTSNIKNEHISQVEVHYQGYIDKLEENGGEESVHQLLIMNPFRTKELSARDPVSDSQIRLAQRNGCLIITTEVLLKLFEMYRNERLSSDECIRVFSEKTGLLKISDFSDEVFDQSIYKI